MYRTALITDIGEHPGYCLQHAEIFIADDKTDTGKTTFLKSYKESSPAVLILFHPFSGTYDLPADVFIYVYSIMKLPKKSVRIPHFQQGNFPIKSGTY